MVEKWKLSTAQKEELKRLYVEEGWRGEYLVRKFRIEHQTVGYHVRGLVRKVPALDRPPEEIRHLYKGRASKPKSYADYLREDRERRSRLSASAHRLTGSIF